MRAQPFLLVLLLLTAIGFAGVSCRKSTPHLSPPGSPSGGGKTTQHHQQGGVDSGGGDASSSEAQTIRKMILQFQKRDLPHAFTRLFQHNLEDLQRFSHLDVEEYDLFKALIGTKQKKDEIINLIRGAQIEFASKDCKTDSVEHKEASARAPNYICFSPSLLMRLPPRGLDLELLSLFAHEVSHLYGFDESQAMRIHDWFLKHREILLPSPKDLDQVLGTIYSIESSLFSIAFALVVQQQTVPDQCSSLSSLNGSINSLNEMVRGIFQVNPKIDKTYALPTEVSRTYSDLEDGFRRLPKICSEGKEDADVKELSDPLVMTNSLLSLRSSLENLKIGVHRFKDPDAKPLLPGTQVAKIQEASALLYELRKSGRTILSTSISTLECRLSQPANPKSSPSLIFSEVGKKSNMIRSGEYPEKTLAAEAALPLVSGKQTQLKVFATQESYSNWRTHKPVVEPYITVFARFISEDGRWQPIEILEKNNVVLTNYKTINSTIPVSLLMTEVRPTMNMKFRFASDSADAPKSETFELACSIDR